MGLLDNFNRIADEAGDDVAAAVDAATQTIQETAADAAATTKNAVAQASSQVDRSFTQARHTIEEASANAVRTANAAARDVARQTEHAIADVLRVSMEAVEDAKRKLEARRKSFEKKVSELRNDVVREGISTGSFAGFSGDADPGLQHFLDGHPRVCSHILWQPMSGIPVPYFLWSSSMKEDLRRNFMSYWNGMATFPTVLPNRKSLADDDEVVQVLDHDDAWSLYIAYVAQSLVSEVQGSLQWSLADYSGAALSELFNSMKMFVWNPALKGYQIRNSHGNVLPSPPSVCIEFLHRGVLDSGNRIATITNLLDWCRRALVHFEGGFNASNVEDQWQYRGFPPVASIIGGTPRTSLPSERIRHRTAGCWGTVGFLRAVLRTVNIPVRLVVHAGHAQPHFVEDELFLTHGDDPYNRMITSALDLPTRELLVDRSQFENWFGGSGHVVDPATQARNVGRRPKDLSITYLPNFLLQESCEDQANGRPRDGGAVFENYRELYSLDELEATQLWSRMDDKIAVLGGCAHVPRS